jgi:hypothetical protein
VLKSPKPTLARSRWQNRKQPCYGLHSLVDDAEPERRL